jgi:organic radical activating enzyme
MLRVREVFRTIQGEGSRAGQPAVFVRFAGCNLWSGLAEHRGQGKGECSRWCDTEFASGDPFEPQALVARVLEVGAGMKRPVVVLTGGEPTLQLRTQAGFQFLGELVKQEVDIAIETNGTTDPETMHSALACLDHVTVSPKPLIGISGVEHVKLREGTDLKVICPSPFTDEEILELAGGFEHLYLQPMDVGGDAGRATLAHTVARAERLGARVSVQSHKLVGMP